MDDLLPDDEKLDDLLRETRILLPGSEIFLAFLMTLPFTQRFGILNEEQLSVYVGTFLSAVLAFACFVTPAAYHRIARPIHDKLRFKVFASRMLVVGLAPMSFSIILVAYLVTSVVVPRWAWMAAAVVGAIICTLWWVVPLERVHDRVKGQRRERSHGEV